MLQLEAAAREGIRGLLRDELQPEYGPFWKEFKKRVKRHSRDVPWDAVNGWWLQPDFISEACWLMRGDRLALAHLRTRFATVAQRLPEGSRYTPAEVAELLERWAREAAQKAMDDRPELGALSLELLLEGKIDELRDELQGPRSTRRELVRWRERFGGRARALRNSDEPGDYFAGREGVLRDMVAWLADPGPAKRVVALKGQPGSGKSAVLARLIALSDAKLRESLDLRGVAPDTIPELGAIDAAIDAKGKSVEQIVDAIAAALGLNAGDSTELADNVAQLGSPVVVAIDSLDEADHPRGVTELVRGIAERGARVLVATRPGGPREEWVSALDECARQINIDDMEMYMDAGDVVDMVAARLRSDAQAPKDYRDTPKLVGLVAKGVVRRVRGTDPQAPPNFLFATVIAWGLTDRPHAVDITLEGWERTLPGTLGAALDRFLDRVGAAVDRARTRDLITALAFARGPGLPDDDKHLWPRIAGALGTGDYDRNDMQWLLNERVADLVEQTADGSIRYYRLVHPLLAEHFASRAGDAQQANDRIYRVLLETAPGVRQNATGPPRPRTRVSTSRRTPPARDASMSCSSISGFSSPPTQPR